MAHSEQHKLPDSMLAWPLYGQGLENLGEDGRPATWPVPRPGPGQLLVRSDAVGLCYSDVKLIRLGAQHPRIAGRDLAVDPVVQGHEVSLTVVEVGAGLEDRFYPGQRLAMQADIYYQGRNLAFGYALRGGLAQYTLIGIEALEGDEGSYAFPVPPELGHAEIALTEPWACVEAAYVPRRRLYPRPGGVMWMVGCPDDHTPYRLGASFARGWPARIVLTDVPETLRREIEQVLPATTTLVVRDGLSALEYAGLARHETQGGFDDVVIFGPDPDLLDEMPGVTAPGAIINLVGARPLDRTVGIDVGRVHYDYVCYYGTPGPDIGAAYGPARNRAELRPSGVAWIIGGGGPLGRMHLQRMLEMDNGPRKIVVTERNPARQPELIRSFLPLAQAKGVQLEVYSPREVSHIELESLLEAAHGGRGFDDIVVMVASVPAIEESMAQLARDGLLVVFAGLARGTMAHLDLTHIYLGNQQITGSAGSTIADQAAVIQKVAAGQLSTAGAVAAIGGMDAAREGMAALMDGRFPGKIVIYPQVPSFPLTALEDLGQIAPEVAALLDDTGGWTRAAEVEFIQRYAGGQA